MLGWVGETGVSLSQPEGRCEEREREAPLETSANAANLRVNNARFWSRLERLAEAGARPGGGVRRIALTEADRDGRDLVAGWNRER
jgi:hypothetical protein